MQQFDYLVFGGGMAGASIGAELATTARVLVIEREAHPGMHSSGRSAALFAESYGGAEIRALTRASRAFLQAPPPGFAEQPLLTPRGALFIATADQRDALAGLAEELAESSPLRVSGGDLLELIPRLHSPPIVEGIFDRHAMDIDVNGLLQGYLRLFRQRGGQLVIEAQDCEVWFANGLWNAAGPWGSAAAPVIVNACGAWADVFAARCGAQPLGLSPRLRTAVLVDPPAGTDITHWPATIDVEETFYFKPDAGKLLLSPADETPSEACDAQPDELDIAIAVDRVQQALDLEVRRVNHSWAGLRTFAPDRVPVVGFDSQVEGFFWLAGQGGYGIQAAPALARLSASLLQRVAAPEDILAEGLDPSRLDPGRFAAAR